MSKKKKRKLSLDDTMITILQKLETLQEDIRHIKTDIDQQVQSYRTNQNMFDKILSQNVNIGNVVAEQTVALKSTIQSLWKNPKILERFPITSEDALINWEDSINEENKAAMVHSVKCLLGKPGIRKTLKLILGQDLLLNYILNGSHTKKRLYKFSKIMDILLHSTINLNDLHAFESDIIKAIKDMKNRHFKDMSVKKKEHQAKTDSND